MDNSKNNFLGTIPRLIEPGTKYFINATLDQCKEFKTRHYNMLYNMAMFVGLVTVIGGILYIMYNRKNNKQLQDYLKREKREYIMNKMHMAHNIQRLNMEKSRNGMMYHPDQLITHLPFPDSPMQEYLKNLQSDTKRQQDQQPAINGTKRFL